MLRPGRITRLRYSLFGKTTSIDVGENHAKSITATNGGTFLIEYEGQNPAIYFMEVAPKEYEIELSAVEYAPPQEVGARNRPEEVKATVQTGEDAVVQVDEDGRPVHENN